MTTFAGIKALNAACRTGLCTHLSESGRASQRLYWAERARRGDRRGNNCDDDTCPCPTGAARRPPSVRRCCCCRVSSVAAARLEGAGGAGGFWRVRVGRPARLPFPPFSFPLATPFVRLSFSASRAWCKARLPPGLDMTLANDDTRARARCARFSRTRVLRSSSRAPWRASRCPVLPAPPRSRQPSSLSPPHCGAPAPAPNKRGDTSRLFAAIRTSVLGPASPSPPASLSCSACETRWRIRYCGTNAATCGRSTPMHPCDHVKQQDGKKHRVAPAYRTSTTTTRTCTPRAGNRTPIRCVGQSCMQCT